MRKALLWALGLAALAGAAPAAAPSSGCDRKCLDGKLGQFLDAVIARDPAKAPLAVGFRQTQNAVALPAGSGIWQTNSGFGPLQRRYYDPVTGNAEFFGLMREGDLPAIVSLRIHVDRDRISEAEWHIARKADPGMTGQPGTTFFDAEKLAARPPVERIVPKGERLPREALLAIVNSYFDGITAVRPQVGMSHPACWRLENGLEVTGRPLQPGNEADGHEGRGNCQTGYKGLNIANVAARRFLVVDEEAQVVVASGVFVRTPANPKRRNNFMEVFAIDGGRISSIHASMFYPEAGQPVPNWAPYYDGSYAITPNLITGN